MLLAVGYPAVTANVSNTVGLVLGNVSAVWGYRRELVGQGRRCLVLGSGTAVGAAAGGALLLILPEDVFEAVVPVLILFACALMVLRPTPRLSRGSLSHHRIGALLVVAFLVGIYGGYFGAAQGVILLAALRLLIPDRLQRLNGLKNVLVGIANGVAAIQFMLIAESPGPRPAWSRSARSPARRSAPPMAGASPTNGCAGRWWRSASRSRSSCWRLERAAQR